MSRRSERRLITSPVVPTVPVGTTGLVKANSFTKFGEIGAWYYKALGGIKPDPAHPGFKNVLLDTHVVTGLDQFEATHNGPYGTIRSAWKWTEKSVTYVVTMPPNSTATLRLPGSSAPQ